MSEAYVGEIRTFAGNYAPRGWALCDGRLLSIYENELLFSLIGTTYGGDGVNNFAVPDLRGRVAIHMGPNYSLGQMGGTETTTLLLQQLPAHTHVPNGSAQAASTTSPTNNLWAQATQAAFVTDLSAPDTVVPMSGQALQPVGGNQPHENMMPFLTVTYIISLYGIYPSRP